MPRIPEIFRALRADGRKALMPFICGGHPRPGDTARLLPALARAGASIVEIGFPFSDPVADGPVIAAAMHEAVAAGVDVASVRGEIASARPNVELGIVAMVSYSIVWRHGPKRFVTEAAAAGVDGFIFPDLPLEESDEAVGLVRDAGLTLSQLVAPSTPPDRAEKIARASSGFVYLLARAGITGETSGPPDVAGPVRMLKGMTDLPIACGFGISTAEHVRQVIDAGADAAIVGSALVRRMSEAASAGNDTVAAAESFVRDLASGLS